MNCGCCGRPAIDANSKTGEGLPIYWCGPCLCPKAPGATYSYHWFTSKTQPPPMKVPKPPPKGKKKFAQKYK